MILAQVIGSIVSTNKHDCYRNRKIMLVRPLNPDKRFSGPAQVAVDTVGAGKGDIVLVASEGRAAMEILQFDRRMPLRSVITAIVDTVDTENTSVKSSRSREK